MIGRLFEKLITQMNAAEPKWVVEPKKIPYAIYDSFDVIETANAIVKELGIKGEVKSAVAYPDWHFRFAVNIKFYGEDEIAMMDVSVRDKDGNLIEEPDLLYKDTPMVWIYAISFIQSGIELKFEDASVLQTYVELYKKLVSEFCKFVDSPVCKLS